MPMASIRDDHGWLRCWSRWTETSVEQSGFAEVTTRGRRYPMTKHKVATREEWQAARGDLLAKEKELTRRGDQLAAEREGIQVRNRPGAKDASRAFRRALAADRLPFHVRLGVHRWLPGLLVRSGHL